ncbi:MAG: 23S rRNA (guanosine(2251)-2'-O)-methyltransferase RlmB [Rhodovarius sp.]|nr:23S rRNA (guanosine(2251)-2'-O)-methyltransferase RlmB [Rhodovarius sp.]MCX7932329.1 23S rRNA (guanosine(2251)-2'-O)-methyltransferase RlmB [Rhodovarius sp.]MDW8316138.1 23S rRNA (guanosine(2251)-2'-O)-methyltransferase RlmB [Rhodovarius sp.]
MTRRPAPSRPAGPAPHGSRPLPSSPRPSRPGAEEAAPRGAFWLYGLHPVAAALANPRRRLRRLLATAEGEAELRRRLPPPWPVPAERAERVQLASLLPADAPHQGLALLAEPLAQPPLAEALAAPGPVLVLDQVTDPRNVGAILRSALAFGAAAVVMQDRHAPPESGALARAASGALERMPLIRVVNLARAIEQLKRHGCWVVGLAGEAPQTLAAAGLAGRRVALVLGAEGEGLRRLTREHCDELCRLPIRPEMESLNVSAAAAVALYELARA